MSSSAITFDSVFKKYSKRQVLHNSLREELVNAVFNRNASSGDLAQDEFWALRDVSFKISEGECVGLYGPNGSGKSTVLKLIANVTYPSQGSVQVSSRVAPLIELGAGFHPDLSGSENIYMNGAILGLTIREIKRKRADILEFSGLRDFVNVPVKKYSSGMALRLAFSIAIHSPAKTFLFDEVLSVGDELFQEKCRHKIEELKKQGKTIVVVSHDRAGMERICHKVLHLNGGVMADSEPAHPQEGESIEP
jgi:ABC-type polysaccharide/polyol phosphate transport system ATPase subunit